MNIEVTAREKINIAINNPLLNLIGSVKIRNKCRNENGDRILESFKEKNCESVVFDRDTKNFHIFPKCVNAQKEITQEFKTKRELIIDELSTQLSGVSKLKGAKIIKGTGSEGAIKIKKYIEYINNQKNKDDLEEGNGMYKYITVLYNEHAYFLKFMRFYLSGKKINCDFKSLQYDFIPKSKKLIVNQGKRGIEICYPNGCDNGKGHQNSRGNICYNPYVCYFDEESIIAKDFIEFIMATDKKYKEQKSSN